MCIENALDTEVEVTCIFGNEITQLLKILVLRTRLNSQLPICFPITIYHL